MTEKPHIPNDTIPLREELFKKIFDSSPLGIALVTREMGFFSVNSAWEIMTGYPKRELLSLTVKDITHPDHISGDMENIRMLMEGKIPVYRTEKRYIRKDGSILWGNLTVSVLRSAAGSVEYLIAQIEDITERKEAEIAIKKSEQQFRETLEILDEGYYHCTLDGTLIEHNRAFNRILGIETGKNMRGFMIPEFWQAPEKREEYLKELRSNGFVRNMIIDAKTIDGQPITVLASAHLIRDDDGRGPTIEGTFADISDLRTTENALREEREFSHLLLDASPAFYVAIDSDGRTLMMNHALLDALEYSEDEVRGKDYLTSFVPPEDRESLQPIFEKNLSGTTTVNINRIISKSGKIFIVEWHGNPVQQRQGKKGGFFVGVGIDITGRRKAETALHESESRLRSFIETTQDAITIIDEEGQVIEWNAGSERLSGISRAEALGRFIWDLNFLLVPPERRTETVYAELKESMKKALATGIPVFREPKVFEAAKQDGTRFFSRHTIFPIKTARGYRFGSVVQDITTEKLAEEALKKSEEQILLLLNSTAEAIYGLDMNGNCTFCNNACLRLLGYNHPEDLLGKNMHVKIHSKYADGSHFPIEKCRIFQAFQKGEGTHVEDEVLWRADGTSFPAEYWSYPQREKGRVIGAVVTFLDISDRKMAEAALRESEEKFRLVAESAPTAIIIQTQGKFAYVNPESARLFGVNAPKDLLGRTIIDRFHPDFRQIVAERIHQLNDLHEPVGGVEEIILKMDGTFVDVEVSAVPVVYKGERGALVFLSDNTDRKRAEQEQEKLIHDLEQKNDELERFTYTVSHDLKSPLITIKGFAGLLEEDVLMSDPARLRTDARRVINAAEKMQDLLSDLLELARIGRVKSPSVRIPFGQIAGEAVELLESSLKERGARVEIDPDLPEVNADHTRIREVLVNLIENAIKYSGDRTDLIIRIGVDRSGEIPVFFVQDNGIGIDPRYLERVFNLFEKLDPAIPGTGIGLPIVKRIIEMHGGKIWVESKGVGKGTTVMFTLPLKVGTSGSG